MNKKYDDDFFDDLDKTTDLLKAFKPHIENNNMDSLESLYSEFNINKNSVKKEEKKTCAEQIERPLPNYNTIETKKQITAQPRREIFEERTRKIVEEPKRDIFKEYPSEIVKELKIDFNDFKIENEISDIKVESNEEKTDISEIIDKMSMETSKKKKNIEVKVESKKENKNEKKSKAKFNFFEVSFISLSIVFIISCAFLYGSKLFSKEEIKPKEINLLSTSLMKNSSITEEGDGLYKVGEDYIYKGQDVDNYVSYSNMIWRIIKKNSDGTIDMITEEYMTTLSWNTAVTSYIETDIHNYLNNDFLKLLDKAYLDKVNICLDDINDINVINCTNLNKDYYVRLLSVDEYINSKLDYTYVAPLTDTLWLGNKSYSKIWQVSGNEVVLNIPTKPLGIKPVIKLHKNVSIKSGDGTKDNPYTLSL